MSRRSGTSCRHVRGEMKTAVSRSVGRELDLQVSASRLLIPLRRWSLEFCPTPFFMAGRNSLGRRPLHHHRQPASGQHLGSEEKALTKPPGDVWLHQERAWPNRWSGQEGRLESKTSRKVPGELFSTDDAANIRTNSSAGPSPSDGGWSTFPTFLTSFAPGSNSPSAFRPSSSWWRSQRNQQL